jgi:hypothetical protein
MEEDVVITKKQKFAIWSLRANSLCNSTQRYFCLFDENALEYSEFCGSTPDFERSGEILAPKRN